MEHLNYTDRGTVLRLLEAAEAEGDPEELDRLLVQAEWDDPISEGIQGHQARASACHDQTGYVRTIPDGLVARDNRDRETAGS